MVSYSAFGGVQSPAVLVIGESDAVETIEKDANEVAMYNGWAFISGAYNEARVYNMQGVVVAEANEGNIDLTNVPAGVYIVNVDGASFKVVK